jgi:hypothetical protein
MRYVLRRNPVRAEEIAATRVGKQASMATLVQERNQYLAGHLVAVRRSRGPFQDFGDRPGRPFPPLGNLLLDQHARADSQVCRIQTGQRPTCGREPAAPAAKPRRQAALRDQLDREQ